MIIKRKMYVTEVWDEIELYPVKLTGDMYTILGTVEVEVEFDMPSGIEIRDMKIDNLKKRITKTKADAQVEVEGLENEIQVLMALEA